MTGIRILYVPNEAGEFRQLGFRRPLADLRRAGLIEDVSVMSLQKRILDGGEREREFANLVERVRTFQPTIVLMQHLGRTRITERVLQAMRDSAEFRLIYHEADPYSRFKHPLPKAAKRAGAAADVVYTVGSGVFAENFRRSGAQDVRWEPHVFESDRYPLRPVDETSHRPFDVVMIANRNTPKFRGLPNWRDRIRFVAMLEREFGDSFAIYGRGWTGRSAQGPVEFSEQADAIRRGWVSANWDHFSSEPKYYSNRLPISLSAGSVHATSSHPGYEDLFDPVKHRFLLTDSNQASLIQKIRNYLETTPLARRLTDAKEAQVFANLYMRQDDQLVRFLNFDEPRIDPLESKRIWRTSGPPLVET